METINFRQDLRLYPGPRDFDGSPTHNLYDPITGRYYKFSWLEGLIYSFSGTASSFEEIVKKINEQTTIRIDVEDVQFFFEQAAQLGLLNIPKTSEEVLINYQKTKSNPLWWFVQNYLYLKIPLFQPDAFLSKTLPYVKILWSKPAIILYFITTMMGLTYVLGHFDEYIHTFSYFFNLEGMLAYGAAIIFVKIVHELSHAYTAKNMGLHIPTIGIVFICLWPVLYTDVTSAWKLPRRKDRLAITVAGVTAELVVAGLATFAWAFTTPGLLQTVFFLLSSVTWISSVLININPAMRFDGYYLLSDLMGVDNLRTRAYAVTRWKWQRWLFGLDLPCPEEQLSPGKIRQLWIYGFASWIYLLIIYAVIALLVYHFFTKALGILLFIVEIAVFFVWPVVWEVQTLYRLRGYFRMNINTIITILVTSLLLIYLCFPWVHTEQFSGVTIPSASQEIWTSSDGLVEEIFVTRGQNITKGNKVINITSKRLEANIQEVEAEIQEIEETIMKWVLDPDKRSLLAEEQAALQSAQFKLKGLLEKKAQLNITANMDGVLYDWDITLKEGQPIAGYQLLGKIAPLNQVSVMTFIPESLNQFLHNGQEVEFSLHSSSTRFKGTIETIGTSTTLHLEYPALASVYHGPLPSYIDSDQKLRLVNSYFPAKIKLEPYPSLPPFGKTGIVSVKGPRESYLMRGIRYVWSVLLQESSL